MNSVQLVALFFKGRVSDNLSITFLFGYWSGHLVDKIDDALVGDAAVGLEAHLAGAAVAVAHLDAVVFQLTAQFPQRPAIDLRVGPAAVAGKAAAADTFGQEDIGCLKAPKKPNWHDSAIVSSESQKTSIYLKLNYLQVVIIRFAANWRTSVAPSVAT